VLKKSPVLSPVFAEKDENRREQTEQDGDKQSTTKMPATLENTTKSPAAVETAGFVFWWTLGDSNP